MDGLKAALSFSVKKLSKSVGIYSAVIGIFFYHAILDKDFQCTCEDQTRVCWSYMILPAFIIFFMVLWLDGSFQALLKHNGLKCTRFCWCLWLYLFRAFFIGMMWPMSVLIDGDWYTCCRHEEKLFCGKLTFEDKNTIKKLKNKSRIIGFDVLLCIVFVAAICRCVPWRKCCTRLKARYARSKGCCTCKSNEPTANSTSNKSKCLSKDDLFKKIVLEVGENLVTDKLIDVAKGKIDQKIDAYVKKKQWGKCYDVVEEIIKELSQHDDSTDPTNTVPTSTVPTNTVPTNTVPTSTVPTNTVPTNTVPTSTVPTNTVPTNTVPTNTVPTSTVPTNTVPTNTVPTNPNPPPGGSPSADRGRNDDEIQPMVQRPSHGSSSDSYSKDDEIQMRQPLIPGSPSESFPNVATSSV